MDGKKKDDESEKTVESESEPAAEAEEKRDEALEDKVVDGDVVVETDEAPPRRPSSARLIRRRMRGLVTRACRDKGSKALWRTTQMMWF